ncbi:MAG: hypothetical protein RR721_12180 [Aeromonas sp.]|uniref:hypothetical protein n=1 Tax=Aeromonas sp. TaxID=647 RepID=UPI002FC6B144
MHHDSTQWMAKLSILGLAILNISPLAMAQQSSTTGEFRKDNSAPQIYSQEGLVNNFPQKLPLGATFAPLLSAWDAEDGDLSSRISQKSGVNTLQPGHYVAEYQVKDNGLPAVDGFKGWGSVTTTFSLPVTVYDPALEHPVNQLALGALWDEGPVINSSLLMAVGSELSRPLWIPGSGLPLLGERLSIRSFQVKEGVWGGNNRQFALRLTDPASGEVLYDGPLTFSTGTTFTPSAPISVLADRDYQFTLRYLAGASKQGFKRNEAGQFWLNAEGVQEQALYPYAQVLADPANQLAFDPGLSRPLKEKLLSSAGGQELLHVRKLPGAEAQVLSYAIADPALATLQIQQGEGEDRLVLSGLQEGETNLEILANGERVDLVRLIVTAPKAVTLSYSYIAFPGEARTHLWDDGALIQRDISRRYAPYNIQLSWVDNGVLVHEWDKDGDGYSTDAGRIEQAAPIKEGWIPNQEQVFSNLYVLRLTKDDARPCPGTGGGSSTGSGPTDAPPRAGYRAACPGNATELGQSLTLAHELGHNLGLWHTKDTEPNGAANLMYVGRQEGIFFASQWRVIHQTLSSRIAAGDPGVSEAKVPSQNR